eukprot:SAG31_NODE_55_length_29938_cov_9.154027_36_plen_374_part_00
MLLATFLDLFALLVIQSDCQSQLFLRAPVPVCRTEQRVLMLLFEQYYVVRSKTAVTVEPSPPANPVIINVLYPGQVVQALDSCMAVVNTSSDEQREEGQEGHGHAAVPRNSSAPRQRLKIRWRDGYERGANSSVSGGWAAQIAASAIAAVGEGWVSSVSANGTELLDRLDPEACCTALPRLILGLLQLHEHELSKAADISELFGMHSDSILPRILGELDDDDQVAELVDVAAALQLGDELAVLELRQRCRAQARTELAELKLRKLEFQTSNAAGTRAGTISANGGQEVPSRSRQKSGSCCFSPTSRSASPGVATSAVVIDRLPSLEDLDSEERATDIDGGWVKIATPRVASMESFGSVGDMEEPVAVETAPQQ